MTYCFPPAPQPFLPIENSDDLLPIHRIFCVGRNYVAHAQEMGTEVDREAPWYFTKSAHHIHHGGEVPFAVGTQDYHHEVELVVAIGTEAQNINVTDALSVIFGHAVGLDMTRRDLQAKSKAERRPWDTGKDVQAGAVIGPLSHHTPDHDAQITLTVNGTVKQTAPLTDMVWSTAEIIAHLSTLYTLRAGDLIMTGTPAGVGAVQRGDKITAHVTNLSPLHATFV